MTQLTMKRPTAEPTAEPVYGGSTKVKTTGKQIDPGDSARKKDLVGDNPAALDKVKARISSGFSPRPEEAKGAVEIDEALLEALRAIAEKYEDDTIDREPTPDEIVSTFESAQTWRSAWGIARDLNCGIEQVRTVIESHSGEFEVSPVEPCGVKLYRPKQ